MTGRWGVFFLTLSVLFFGTGNYWSATWLSKWALILALSSGAISLWAARRTSLWYLPLMLYLYGSLLYLGVWQSHYAQTLDPVTLLALQKNALYGILQVTACLILFGAITSSAIVPAHFSLIAIWAVGVGRILSLPLSGPFSAPNNGLWFGNPSMGASLLACLLPSVWAVSPKFGKIMKPLAWVLTLAAIYKTRASVPWGVLGVVTSVAIAVNTFRYRRSWLWILGSFVSIAAFLSALGMRLLGDDFWDQNGRFEIWKMALDWSKTHGNMWFGQGFSSTQVLLPIEQVVMGHYHGDYFLWLHNDWLQIFIEGGYLGAACVALAVGRALWVSRHKLILPSLCGFATLALFNYPLRMPIHVYCLVLMLGVREAVNRSVEKRDLTPAPGVRKKHLEPA